MKVFLFLFSIWIGLGSQPVFADSIDKNQLTQSESLSEISNISVEVNNIEIDPANEHSSKRAALFFDVLLKNTSAYQKSDIQFPIDVFVEDEFGNSYRNESLHVLGTEGQDVLDLYPGESIRIICRFQAPVAAAKVISIHVLDRERYLRHRIDVATQQIKNWSRIAKDEEFTRDDLIVVFPRDKKVFAPGEKLYLKLDFSRRAGRPDNIHVILPDYILTDEQALGQYELEVPENREDGDFQIIVMAEWGDSPNSTIVSKTLLFKIKG